MSEGQGPTGLERANLELAKSKTGAEGAGRKKEPEKLLATWIVPDPQELKGLNPELKKVIEKIGKQKEVFLTFEEVRNAYMKLEELVDRNAVTDAEIATWADRLTSKAQNLKNPPPVSQPGPSNSQEMGSLRGLSPAEVVFRVLGEPPKPPVLGDDSMDDRESREARKARVLATDAYARAAGSANLAEAMGILPPEKQLDEFYRPLERDGEVPIQVVQPLPFMVMYDSDRHAEMPENEGKRQFQSWKVRGQLLSGAFQKTVAGSVDSVANPIAEVEKRLDPLGIKFNKENLEYLFENQPGTLEATSIWTTIIGGKEYIGENPPDLREKLLNFAAKIYKNDKEFKKERDTYIEALKKLGLNKNEIDKILNTFKQVAETFGFKVTIDTENKTHSSRPKNLKEDFSNELEYLRQLKKLGFSERETRKLVTERQSLLENCPPSVWAANQPEFGRIRDSIQYWLKTQGRHFLYLRRMVPRKDQNGKPFKLRDSEHWKETLSWVEKFSNLGQSDEAREQREKLLVETKVSKELTLEELEGLAKDAEQPAWNLVFTSGLLESFNTEEACWWLKYRAKGVKGPSNHMTLYLWMDQHPVQRWAAKIFGGAGVREEDSEINRSGEETGRITVNLKENWSHMGVWGTNQVARMSRVRMDEIPFKPEEPWTLYNKTFINKTGNQETTLKLVYPKFLSPDLVKDAFRQESGNRKAFFDNFSYIGAKILGNPKWRENNDQLYDETIRNNGDWQELNDTPFVNYRFDNLRWGLTAYTLFKKGPDSERDVSWPDIQEAFYRLNLSRDERMALLIFRDGLNQRANNIIQPARGNISFAIHLVELQKDPEIGLENLFKNKAVGQPIRQEFDLGGYPTKTKEEWNNTKARVVNIK